MKSVSTKFIGIISILAINVISIPAAANPEGGNIASGEAKISYDKRTVTIDQFSDRAIIDWKSFDINKGETAIFNQPSSSSIALNRITDGSKASQILGSLSANGQIILINPNGVFISKNAQINVSSLIASSADISNDAFLKEKTNFEFDKSGNANASIINKGKITVADEGLALLVAPNVVNDGVITGHLARIQLAAGDMFAVDLYGDGLMSLAIDEKVSNKMIKAENNGKIIADGGSVILTSADVKDMVESVVNNDGVIEAKTYKEYKGKIILGDEKAEVKRKLREEKKLAKKEKHKLKKDRKNNDKIVEVLPVLELVTVVTPQPVIQEIVQVVTPPVVIIPTPEVTIIEEKPVVKQVSKKTNKEHSKEEPVKKKSRLTKLEAEDNLWKIETNEIKLNSATLAKSNDLEPASGNNCSDKRASKSCL